MSTIDLLDKEPYYREKKLIKYGSAHQKPVKS
jgi:hypothetical protein